MTETEETDENQIQDQECRQAFDFQQQQARRRSFQRMHSIKRQDSWTDFKDRAFKVATAVCLPKHKRAFVTAAGGSMKTSATSQSVKSLPQLKPCDTLKLRKNFRRSISAQEPSAIHRSKKVGASWDYEDHQTAFAHDPPPRLVKGRSPKKVLFAPEPCIDEERERSISESSSAPSVLEVDETESNRSRKSQSAPAPAFSHTGIPSAEDSSTNNNVSYGLFDVEEDEEPVFPTSLMRRDIPPGFPFARQKSRDDLSEEDLMESQMEKDEFTDDEAEDDLSYSDFYSCMPPPIFMLCITMIEVGFFIYHAKILMKDPKYGYIGKYSPAPIDSKLIYSPIHRLELWRWITYAMVHSGYMHLINNIVVQLALGILLEMVHKFWRVLAIYFAGILAGSLATSIAEPFNYLAGASAGVYALITAHLSTDLCGCFGGFIHFLFGKKEKEPQFTNVSSCLRNISGFNGGKRYAINSHLVILNWTEMERPWIRILVFVAFVIHDGGTAIYFTYIVGEKTNVGYAAHLGGAVAGLLVGSLALKNLKWEEWEKTLWYASIVICIFLLVFAIVWNVVRTDLYP